MMKRYITAGFAVCVVGYATGASAMDPTAVVRQPQGKVFVSQGSAMTLAQEGMPLYAGNRVITVSGSHAEVAYTDGCVVTLPANRLLAVKGSDQCRLGQAQVRATDSFQSTRIGQAPSSSPIADFKNPKGSVSANEIPVRGNMDARRDDQIVTGEDSGVKVAFRSCEVEVGPGEQVTVSALRERCNAGVVLASGGDLNDEVAILKKPQGAVMVNGGSARNDMGLTSSSQIITGSGGKVTVIFKGCTVAVGEKENVRVGDLVTKCPGGLWADAGIGGVGAAAGAGGVGAAAGGVGVGIGGVGGVIVGGALAVTLGTAIAQGNDNGPASPAR